MARQRDNAAHRGELLQAALLMIVLVVLLILSRLPAI